MWGYYRLCERYNKLLYNRVCFYSLCRIFSMVQFLIVRIYLFWVDFRMCSCYLTKIFMYIFLSFLLYVFRFSSIFGSSSMFEVLILTLSSFPCDILLNDLIIHYINSEQWEQWAMHTNFCWNQNQNQIHRRVTLIRNNRQFDFWIYVICCLFNLDWIWHYSQHL